jgi:hypothetical protein
LKTKNNIVPFITNEPQTARQSIDAAKRAHGEFLLGDIPCSKRFVDDILKNDPEVQVTKLVTKVPQRVMTVKQFGYSKN